MKAGEAESRRAGETLPAHTTLPAIFGVALATGRDIAEARERATECAHRVKPRA
jgi:hypothetical protein